MRTLLLTLSATLALTACATTDSDGTVPLNALARYTLQVEPGVDRVALAVHESGLSPNQHSALRDLAGRYRAAGAGMVRVEAPAGDDPVAARQAYDIRLALSAAGVPAERIQLASYSAPNPRAPVLAGFETFTLAVPNCSLIPRQMGGRSSNLSSPGLGCAVTANMAAQIANPRDVIAPRAMTPPDSGRAAVVFDSYRKGEPASAPQEELVQGRIASAVD